MKKFKFLFGGSIVALALVLSSFAMKADAVVPANWNTSGSYVMSMEYGGTPYTHDMSLVQDTSGNLTGSGGSPVGGNVYTWVITSGSVSGNTIDFMANYTATSDAVSPQTVLHITGTIANNGTITGTWSDNYQGGARTGAVSTVSGQAVLLGALAAEDFGVVNYDTGLGMLKGYTAGFGVTGMTLEGAQSVVVKLYGAGDTLLQTNTAILTKFNADITGTQFSSPFDVSGTFNYVTDGYWTNVHEAQYGQSIPATKVVATVTLSNGKVVTAQNTNLTGDPTTIYPPATHMLTVARVGTGSGNVTSTPAGINCGVDCTESFTSGTSISLVAIPVVGSTFTGFSGDCTGTGPCTVVMSAVKSVTATFTEDSTNGTPTDKNACKKGGWKNFTNPSFKNQGQCVSYTNHN